VIAVLLYINDNNNLSLTRNDNTDIQFDLFYADTEFKRTDLGRNSRDKTNQIRREGKKNKVVRLISSFDVLLFTDSPISGCNTDDFGNSAAELAPLHAHAPRALALSLIGSYSRYCQPFATKRNAVLFVLPVPLYKPLVKGIQYRFTIHSRTPFSFSASLPTFQQQVLLLLFVGSMRVMYFSRVGSADRPLVRASKILCIR